MTSPTSPRAAGTKRAYQADNLSTLPDARSENEHDTSSAAQVSSSAITSAFRNVSACNRCRVRKNRCDQSLPACSACEKAGTRCVGFDPITRKEIPRSYVYFLETRMLYLESLLIDNKISFEVANAFEGGPIAGRDDRLSQSSNAVSKKEVDAKTNSRQQVWGDGDVQEQEDEKINKIVSDIGMVSVHGASDRRYLGSTSGISFARVVLAAIKSSVPTTSSDRSGRRGGRSPPNSTRGEGNSMRDSYFGLSNRPNIKEAAFPDQELGLKLVTLYFEHANPQIPVLHRVEFMELFERAYTVGHTNCTSQELYLLNIVFAIGAGVIFGSSDSDATPNESDDTPVKRARLSGLQAQPEEYHASAIVHLSSFFTTPVAAEGPERVGGDLEDLQAILLLAGFALLRPVAPGLWYIVGVAMRLAIDLGLHFEDGLDLDGSISQLSNDPAQVSRRNLDPEERGRREWIRDMRRRLWWCTYCFDRLVSTCVGRPFGMTDSVVTTEFPSLLDDKYITRHGLSQTVSPDEPTYKHVACHYLRLRLLQSEILQVLQHQQAQQARSQGALQGNRFINKDNPSPFLTRFLDFRTWRSDVDQRLWEWKESAPSRAETGVAFSPQFLELNYWQAVIMLYRNSLSVPEPLAGEISPTEEVSTPTSPPAEEKDDQDLVFLKCAEAGQKTLKLYRQLHRKRLVNYTYLATHHLFMAGISFLYAVWHSPVVRTNLTLDDFDFTVLAATSVLGDLMEKCPPAKACRDAFERMSKATVQMCMTTPGFRLGQSSEVSSNSSPIPPSIGDSMLVDSPQAHRRPALRKPTNRRPPPQFDMDLHELFPDELDRVRRPSVVLSHSSTRKHGARNSRQRYSSTQQQRHHHQYPVYAQHDYQHRSSPSGGNEPEPYHNLDTSSSPTQLQTHLSTSNTRSHPTATNAPSYFNINQNSYNPDFMSNVPGMEFLNNLGSNTAMNNSALNAGPSFSNAQLQAPLSPIGSIHSQSPSAGFNFEGLMDSPSGMRWDNIDYPGGPTSAATFDFGVGMGLDFTAQTSWAEPQGAFDLDGFFFGGATVRNSTHDTNTNFNNENDTGNGRSEHPNQDHDR